MSPPGQQLTGRRTRCWGRLHKYSLLVGRVLANCAPAIAHLVFVDDASTNTESSIEDVVAKLKDPATRSITLAATNGDIGETRSPILDNPTWPCGNMDGVPGIQGQVLTGQEPPQKHYQNRTPQEQHPTVGSLRSAGVYLDIMCRWVMCPSVVQQGEEMPTVGL